MTGDHVDEAVPCVLGLVAVHEGDTEHWERDPDTGDVHVSVVTHGHGSPIKALLHGIGGRIWVIPSVGTEVAVVFPDGDFEGDPVLYGGGGAPEDLDGVTIVIEAPPGGKVKVRQSGGTSVELPTMADLNALREHVDRQFAQTGGHTHAVVGLATTTIAAAMPVPATPTTDPAPTPTGTTVLEAE